MYQERYRALAVHDPVIVRQRQVHHRPDDHLPGTGHRPVLDPVQADGAFWLIRLEGREEAGAYTEEQIAALTELRFEEALAAARDRVTIERDFTADDANWAIEEAS